MSRFQFTREPLLCDLTIYQAVLDKCISVFSTYPGIRAIYQYGGVSAPGISDLDVLLVFEEGTSLPSTKWRESFNKPESYLLMHDPTVISPSLLAEGHYITSLQGLTLLWGQPYAIHSLEPSVADIVNHWIVLEHTTRLYVSLMRQWQLGLVKQRSLLCELHSIRYDLALTGLLSPHEESFLQPIRQLRQTWFVMPQHERQKQILVLFELALQIEQALLSHLESWTAKLMPSSNSLTQGVYQTQWLGIQLVSNTDYLNISNGFALLAHLPSAVVREKLARFFNLQIGLPPNLFALLSGKINPFLEPYAPVYQKRQATLYQYAQFCNQLGGGFGRLHSSVLG